jgi:tetratricopeptide (TPR) repeat protein
VLARLRTFAKAGLLVALTMAVYVPAIRGGYSWDDDDYVTRNEALRTLEGLRRIWFEPGTTSQYYPLVHTTFWVEYHLWRLKPAGYHAVNVLLHGLSAVLLWTLLRRLAVPGAWLAAAVFALHPVHVESVAWITERKNVLSGVFYLGSLLAYRRFCGLTTAPAAPRRLWRFYALSLVLFAGALFSKTVTCTLPVAILLLIWWKRGRVAWRNVTPLLPMFALGLLMGLTTIWMEAYHVGTRKLEWDLSLLDRCLIAGRAPWFYLFKLVWPVTLTFIYPRWQIDPSAWWQYVFPAAAVGGIVMLGLLRRRIGRGPLAAVLFFVVTLGPALGFVNVFSMRYSFVADHFQYLASIGPIVLIVGLLTLGLERLGAKTRWLATAVPVTLLVVLAGLTWRQARIYENTETLWRDTIRKNPSAWIAYNNLGNVLVNTGRRDEALACFRKALELYPGCEDAHVSLGYALSLGGDYDAAIRHYRRALELAPRNILCLNNLGNAQLGQHKIDEAIATFRQALAIDLQRADTHNNLGGALVTAGELEAGAKHYARAVELRPDLLAAHYNLAQTYRRLQRPADAKTEYLRALSLAEDSGEHAIADRIRSRLASLE